MLYKCLGETNSTLLQMDIRKSPDPFRMDDLLMRVRRKEEGKTHITEKKKVGDDKENERPLY